MATVRRSGLAALACAIVCALTFGLTTVAGAEEPPDYSDTDGAGTQSTDGDEAEADDATDQDQTGADSDTIDLNKPVTDDQLVTVTDFLVFKASMSQFQYERRLRVLDDQVSWGATLCDRALKDPLYDFKPACQRREFGYQNFKRQDRFSDGKQQRTDDKFRDDLKDVCKDKDFLTKATCERQATLYADTVVVLN
jgi:hypothetical protein